MAKQTLLIVEDNKALREGLSEILSSDGFTVVTARNGRQALETMGDTLPDLILSDIAMPEMDGFAFFNAVRARPEWVSIPFVFLTAHAGEENLLASKNLGVEDFLAKPLTPDELLTAVRARLDRSRQLQVAQLHQAYLASLAALANAIDLRDRYSQRHIERVTALALVLGIHLELPGWQLAALRYGAILHDVGKIHIDEGILFKAAPLTGEEWDEIHQHPVTGAEMIKDIPLLAPAAPIVRHHHERWDGQGYPDGLAGEATPLGARLVALAEALDAMTTGHPYKAARTAPQAYQEILSCSAKQFDPSVVGAFQEAWEAGHVQQILSYRKTDPS